ncbi:MAG: hypothetical protein A2Y33_05040 [Spirochaetes bacterium GWF1_51_8]|nr:MAG: hypothetical protein A2Y33_05040 [Spirochaetes bacterium GWF1_51_8]
MADNGAFGIKLYYYSDEIIYMIKSLLDETLKIVEKNELRNMIYNGVKEIVINGIKANLKRVVFKQNQLDLDNLDHYTYGMNLFRDFLSAHTPEEIEKTLIKNGYELVILCAKVDNGLRIEVMNNCELCSIEEARIRERFRLAMQYKDLVSFMDDHSNHIEGSGLGIFLLILMLREHGIDPSYFRVGKKYQGYTVSRIEIPFNKDFLGIRED